MYSLAQHSFYPALTVMLIAICLLHSCLRPREQTDLKVHFSHSRQARSGGPRHTPGCAQGCWGIWRRPARSLLGLRWTLLLWRPGGGPCRPDRSLRRGEEETDVIFEEVKKGFRVDTVYKLSETEIISVILSSLTRSLIFHFKYKVLSFKSVLCFYS